MKLQRFSAIVLVSAVLAAPAAFGASAWEELKAGALELGLPPPPGEPPRLRQDGVRVFGQAVGSVVTIEVKMAGKTPSFGTGFIIDADGLILTNSHVVNPPPIILETGLLFPLPLPVIDLLGKKMFVTLYEKSPEDGRMIKTDYRQATMVGWDPQRDIAVLKIDAGRKLPALKIQEKVSVGQPVWAIGAPFGYAQSISEGIVSATGRFVGPTVIPAIQTTAALNPGNSGGPLLNAKGEVVGLNTAIFSGVGENNGVGFSLPIGAVMPYVRQIIKTGTTTLGTIEARFDNAGIKDPSGAYVGYAAVVSTMTAGGSAESAGLKVGDFVFSINGKILRDSVDLVHAINDANPGDVLSLSVIRGQSALAIEVRVVDARKPRAARPPGS